MNVFFRVDASNTIGTGHVFRCLNLAKFLKKKGWQIFFLCKQLNGNLISLIKRNNFDVFSYISKDHNNIVDLNEDLNFTIKQVHQIKPKWLILDHYNLDYE